MTGFAIVDDRVAIDIDTGIKGMLNICIKSGLKQWSARASKARPTEEFLLRRAPTANFV